MLIIMKFIENVDRASTSSRLNGDFIGHNVNAVAYKCADGVRAKSFKTHEDYVEWKEKLQETGLPLFLAAIEAFGTEVMR